MTDTHKPILHLIFDDKFIDQAISLFESAYPGKSNYLLDVPRGKYSLRYIHRNASKIDIAVRGSKDYFSRLAEYNPSVIILHSLSYYFAHVLNAKIRNEKVIWIFWGGEVYDYLKGFRGDNFLKKTKVPGRIFLTKTILRNVLRPLYFRILNPSERWDFSKYRAMQKVNGIALAHQLEFENLKSKLNIECSFHWFSYFTIEYLISKDLFSINSMQNNILIGNSATPSNNHLDILYRLKSELAIEDRKIYVPLSYGENWYKQRVIKHGNRLFPGNFKPLTRFLPLRDYNRILFECSVVIMNHLRQQAVGNLIVSFWIGAKVFLNEVNPLYYYFKHIGLIVYSIQKDICRINDLAPLTHEEIAEQRAILIKYYSEQNIITQIQHMLAEYLSNQSYRRST